MISWVNYHSHTHFCDGTSAPEEYIREAIRLGIPAYGFSSHAPVPFATDWNIPGGDLPGYLAEIKNLKETYRSQIQIYRGLEIDFIPGVAGRRKHLLTETELDYFIGSIHFVEQFENGEYWNIDTSYEIFRRGLRELFQNGFRRAAIRFWEITRQMIEEDHPTLIGHLDKIKMFNTKGHFFDESESWYTDQVELTLNLIKKTGSIVEINTRGYYRYNQPDLYPGEKIIRQLVKKDIPVTISSDAHHPDEITKGIPYAVAVLKKQGVKKLAALYNNKWEEFPFDEKGIHFN